MHRMFKTSFQVFTTYCIPYDIASFCFSQLFIGSTKELKVNRNG